MRFTTLQTEHAQLLAVVAAVLALSYATYFKRRQIRKSRSGFVPATWFSWTVVNIVSLTAQLKAGNNPVELGVPAIQLGSTFFLLGVTLWCMIISKGEVCRPSWFDYGILLACCLGTTIWAATDNLYLALGVNAVLNIVGVIPEWRHVWQSPHTDTTKYWLLRMSSTACASYAFVCYGKLNLAGVIPNATGVGLAFSVLVVIFCRKLTSLRWLPFTQTRPLPTT